MIDDAKMPAIEKSNQLLIQVKAASVNVVDTKICYGYSKIYRKLLNTGVSSLKCHLVLFYYLNQLVNYFYLFTSRNIKTYQ